jgi:3-phosphoinositide dependent protein kinase-1
MQVRDLVESLLRLEPSERLGATDMTLHGAYQSIKRHPFFSGLDFDRLYQTTPPFTLDTADHLKGRIHAVGSAN